MKLKVVIDGEFREDITPANINNIVNVHRGGRLICYECVLHDFDDVAALIAMVVNVNKTTVDGQRPLGAARSRPCILRILLDAGAHINASNSAWLETETSMHQLVGHNIINTTLECRRTLIDYGALLPSDCDREESERLQTMLHERQCCRAASMAMASLKHAQCPLECVKGQDTNVLRLVAKHVWSTRFDDKWGKEGNKKKNKN